MLLAVLILGLLGGGSAASAGDSPAATGRVAALDQGAIYHILCGGLAMEDTPLSAHLWEVAGSLANGNWKPPKVTIRVVVSNASGR